MHIIELMFIHISITEIFNRALLNILVLVLTGNPGVGKHTVSRKLAEILGYEIVDVNKEAVKVGATKQNDSIDVDVEKTKHAMDRRFWRFILWNGRKMFTSLL